MAAVTGSTVGITDGVRLVAMTGEGRRLGGHGWQWDVALSYAGAQRNYVAQVTAELKEHGVACFWDQDEQIDLWGKYLAEELPAIYNERAGAVVIFVSAEYVNRDWTRLERRAAFERAARERREYVLPARFDDTPLPGMPGDMVTVDLRGRSPQEFARLTLAKLVRLSVVAPAGEHRGPPANGYPRGSPDGPAVPVNAASHRPGGRTAAALTAGLAALGVTAAAVSLMIRQADRPASEPLPTAPPATTTAVPTPSASPVLSTSPPAPASAGLDGGLTFTVDSIRCGATRSGIVTATAGNELCEARTTAWNHGGAGIFFQSDLQYLVDGTGRRYPASYYSDMEHLNFVLPHSTAVRDLVFDVPRGTTPDHLAMQGGTSSTGDGVPVPLPGGRPEPDH